MTGLPGVSNSWLQLDFKGPGGARELVVELCWELETIGLTDSSDASFLSIQAFFPTARREGLLNETRQGLKQRGVDIEVALSDFAFDPDEWVRNWKKEFKAFEVAPDYYIHPPWTPPSESHRHNISIEPGHAFGTGTHESTQLVLELASLVTPQPARSLDIGTGSGILSIALNKRFPGTHIVALDIDPMAIAAASENLARNETPGVSLVVGGPEAITGVFDLVLANLTLALFQRVSSRISRSAKGCLIVSGFTTEQRSSVLECFPDFEPREVVTRRGWEGILLERRAS